MCKWNWRQNNDEKKKKKIPLCRYVHGFSIRWWIWFVSWNGCVSNREGEIGIGPTDWEKGLDCTLKYLVIFEKEKKGDNGFNECRSQKMRSRETMTEWERNVYVTHYVDSCPKLTVGNLLAPCWQWAKWPAQCWKLSTLGKKLPNVDWV